MSLWNKWSRKLDGWVERRRHFQKKSVEKAHDAVEPKVPAADVATKPKSAAELR